MFVKKRKWRNPRTVTIATILGSESIAVPDVTKKLILWHKYKKTRMNIKKPKKKRSPLK